MAAVIIYKKDVERLGKKTLKDVYNFLHNSYVVTEFEKMKVEQEKLDHRLLINEVNKNKKFKNYFDLDEVSKKEMEEEIKNITVNNVYNGRVNHIDDIYHFLIDIVIEEEVDDDVMFELESFLEIYRVFTYNHSYLED